MSKCFCTEDAFANHAELAPIVMSPSYLWATAACEVAFTVFPYTC